MSGEWSNGLCGCFSNITLCLVSYVAPCYTAGKNAESVGDDCLLCGLVVMVPIANIYFPATIRGKIREQKGIAGSLVNDLLMHCCCALCAIVQEANEMKSTQFNQAIDRQ
ncbi:uncharacterized protein LOC135495033 [Lineus longissimus]|uniref:uncharacterized protein LOC135495033 n=1 Tax=Lineus longissimus TaxID=88925 RepID=UPI00315D40FA